MSEDNTWNLNEVNKELKPEIIYKSWVKGVPDKKNVIYLKITEPTSDYTNIKIIVECVDYLGKRLDNGSLVGIDTDNKLIRFCCINDTLGFKLNEDGMLIKSDHE